LSVEPANNNAIPIQDTTDATLTAPAESGSTDPASTTATTTTSADPATGTNTTALKKISIKSTKFAPSTNKASFAHTEEEENVRVREIIKLEYTQEELNELNNATNNAYSYLVDNDYQDGDFGTIKKKGTNMTVAGTNVVSSGVSGAAGVPGVVDIASIQARVLAQAQAISAALKQSTAAVGASVSSASKVSAPVVSEQDRLKSLVEKIPTEK
jgi:hypothetical protein